jgi:hypothetical protein
MGMEKVTSWLKATYDRLIAVVILAVLIVSLLYLAVKIGIVRAQQAAWENEIVNLVPDNPDAESVSPNDFKLAMSRLEKPHIVPQGTWTRRLVVPEERFWCEDCRYPNPMAADVCASCEQELDSGKLPPDFDEDGDGIPNVAEETYGLDPLDPSDAALDKDSDGFDNLLEHTKGTDPRDPNSKPSIEAWIVLDEIEAEAFNLLFKAYSTLPDGKKMFQLNTRTGGKTHFVKMGGEIESFTVVGFETNFVQQLKPIKRTVDQSKLSLKKGEKTIVLVKGQKVKWDEFNATIRYERTNQQFLIHKGDLFELEANKYKVLRIDTTSRTVVINRLSDNKEFQIESKRVGTALPPAEEAPDSDADEVEE